MTPLSSPKTTWESIETVASRPIWASWTPSASMNTDAYGSTSIIDRPHMGSV